MRRSQGFTLLELMIALAVFALMVTLSYGSVSLLMDASRRTEGRQADLQQLQRAMLFLERDVHQLVNRRANIGYGETLPAVEKPDNANGVLELTRGGNPDMAWQLRTSELMRSTLQRVRYTLDGKKLIRESWNLIDRADAQEPVSMVLLDGVKSIEIGFIDDKNKVQDDWSEEKKGLPRAIEVALEHDDFGEIKRIILVYL